MGRLISFFGGSLIYLCVGTITSACVFFAVAWFKGYLNREKVVSLIAVMRGEMTLAAATQNESNTASRPKPPSFEELDQQRTTYTRNLELREQALQNEKDQLAGLRERLLKERKSLEMLVSDYRKQIKDADEGRVKKGYEDVRMIWENIKPKQAKELILKMIDADEKDQVVAIFSSMPVPKQGKIVQEFKDEEEVKKLDDILRRIREGATGAAPSDAPESDTSAAPIPRP